MPRRRLSSVEKTPSLLNHFGAESLASSVGFSVTFVCSYMSLYRPSTTQLFFFPEGKYGPPLIREQFVACMAFAVLTGLAGFVCTAWQPSTCLLFRQERLNVEQEVRRSGRRVAERVPVMLAVVFLLYCFNMSVFGSQLLRAIRLSLRYFIAYRAAPCRLDLTTL